MLVEELEVEGGILNLLEMKRDGLAWRQAEAAMSRGHRASSIRQLDHLVSREDQFALAGRRQAQSDLAIAVRALCSHIYRA